MVLVWFCMIDIQNLLFEGHRFSTFQNLSTVPESTKSPPHQPLLMVQMVQSWFRSCVSPCGNGAPMAKKFVKLMRVQSHLDLFYIIAPFQPNVNRDRDGRARFRTVRSRSRNGGVGCPTRYTSGCRTIVL